MFVFFVLFFILPHRIFVLLQVFPFSLFCRLVNDVILILAFKYVEIIICSLHYIHCFLMKLNTLSLELIKLEINLDDIQ